MKVKWQHPLLTGVLISPFLALFNSALVSAGPCEIKQVAQNSYLIDSVANMVITPNQQWGLVLDEVAGDVKVVDVDNVANPQIITTLYLEDLEVPGGLTLSADGTTLYVSGAFDGKIVVADISTTEPSQWRIKETWPITGDFGAMQFDPNTPRFFVTDRDVKGVRVFSTEGNELATLSTSHCAVPTDLIQKDSFLFVACETSNKVAVFDLDTMSSHSDISVGDAPVALWHHPNLPDLYVANRDAGSLSIINTESLELKKRELSNASLLSNPVDMVWVQNTLWILDQSAATLVGFNPSTEEFKAGVCTGIGNRPKMLVTATLSEQDIIYVTHGDGIDYLSINIRQVRQKPQVLMAGFDPIRLDSSDTDFRVIAVVEEGANVLKDVSITLKGKLDFGMTFVGTMPLTIKDRQIDALVYEMEFPRDRYAFRGSLAKVMGLGNNFKQTPSLFGEKSKHFQICARDEALEQHCYPNWHYGTWPLVETQAAGKATTGDIYSRRGPCRSEPQVLMGGFSPMFMDLADTELTVLAVVRPGNAAIQQIALTWPSGNIQTTLNKVSDLPNGDELYQGTALTAQETPLFPEGTVFDNVWNDYFQIVVTDEAQQSHQFPDFQAGNYPTVECH
jgi:DNA-binding beta-propeller fold protein YncE